VATEPELRRQTHIFDGVDAALAMLAGEGVRSGSIVVLSDGSDTGSRVDLTEAADRARAAGVRVFSVGLRSNAFEPHSLESLADQAGGRYSEASSPGDLSRIYRELGSALANEHLIQYRSNAEPRSEVLLRVDVDGLGSATDSYRAPGVNAAPAAPFDRDELWSSPLVLVVVCLMCGALLALALFTLTRRPHRRPLRERMAQFVGPPADADDQPRRTLLGHHAKGAVERRLERLAWWPAFEEELDVARIQVDPVRFAAGCAVATLLAAWLVFAVSGTVLLAIGLLVFAPFGIRVFVRSRAQSERTLFADQLADNLQVIASAQRAGHSFLGALTVSVEEAPEPTKREFERVLADERLGLPLDDGLAVVAGRMQSRDLQQVILVANLQKATGGNAAEVLDKVAETVRERGELRRLVASLTVQGRMSRWIVTALPLVLLVVVSMLNPTYMEPLFETTGGRIALALAGVLLLTGSLAIKRIVAIKV
jgi:tight adherence protein B